MMTASVSLAGYCVDTSKFYDFMFINVCQGCFCFSSDFLFFLRWLIFCKVLHVQIAFIYVPHFFWTPIWWTVYSREIINTDCHFWFRKRSVLRPLETDPTHELIVVYIYKALWTKKKKRDQDNALSNFSSDLKKKKHAHVQVPIYLQIKCRCN